MASCVKAEETHGNSTTSPGNDPKRIQAAPQFPRPSQGIGMDAGELKNLHRYDRMLPIGGCHQPVGWRLTDRRRTGDGKGESMEGLEQIREELSSRNWDDRRLLNTVDTVLRRLFRSWSELDPHTRGRVDQLRMATAAAAGNSSISAAERGAVLARFLDDLAAIDAAPSHHLPGYARGQNERWRCLCNAKGHQLPAGRQFNAADERRSFPLYASCGYDRNTALGCARQGNRQFIRPAPAERSSRRCQSNCPAAAYPFLPFGFSRRPCRGRAQRRGLWSSSTPMWTFR